MCGFENVGPPGSFRRRWNWVVPLGAAGGHRDQMTPKGAAALPTPVRGRRADLTRRSVAVEHLLEQAGLDIEDEAAHGIRVMQERRIADAAHRLPHGVVGVEKGLHRPGRAVSGELSELCAELVLPQLGQAAVGVVDDHHLAGAERVLRDRERADDVVGDDPARVAHQVDLARLQLKGNVRVHAAVHAEHERELFQRRRTEPGGVEFGRGAVALEHLIDRRHGSSFGVAPGKSAGARLPSRL